MKILVAGLLTLALMAVCATAFSSMQFRHRSLSGQMRNRLANVTAPPTNYWFEQKLDHFNPLDARVFRQRYWMNDTFADGKTLLFAFAGEAPLQDFYGVSDNFLTLLCQQNNMLLIYIEHRCMLLIILAIVFSAFAHPVSLSLSPSLWRVSS